VLVGCRRRGDALSIQVWDTGMGIAESDQRVIFEEFRRLDRGGQGLGLGLAIAERVARLLDHPLRLRSWPGRGTVFSIEVPLAAPLPAVATVPERPPPEPPRSRVLVVDNDPDVLRGMQALLGGWQCEVLAARDGDEALRLVAGAVPDLLLLDFHLDGGQTGLMLRERLAAAMPARPCVIITADHDIAVRDAIAAAGCVLLHKPLKPLALKSVMARLLQNR
jgi:CheY-like chemotaxis protein